MHTVTIVVQVDLAKVTVGIRVAVEEVARATVASSRSAGLHVGVAVGADDKAKVVVVVKAIIAALSCYTSPQLLKCAVN